MPLVAVVMGSGNDAPYLEEAIALLAELGIDYEVRVMSAHRHPEVVRDYGLKAKERGIEVIIAAAGGAAHLPGVMAGWTPLPVIGLPLPTSELKGVDALYSIVQMPSGVPVACVGIGNARVGQGEVRVKTRCFLKVLDSLTHALAGRVVPIEESTLQIGLVSRGVDGAGPGGRSSGPG